MTTFESLSRLLRRGVVLPTVTSSSGLPEAQAASDLQRVPRRLAVRQSAPASRGHNGNAHSHFGSALSDFVFRRLRCRRCLPFRPPGASPPCSRMSPVLACAEVVTTPVARFLSCDMFSGNLPSEDGVFARVPPLTGWIRLQGFELRKSPCIQSPGVTLTIGADPLMGFHLPGVFSPPATTAPIARSPLTYF